MTSLGRFPSIVRIRRIASFVTAQCFNLHIQPVGLVSSFSKIPGNCLATYTSPTFALLIACNPKEKWVDKVLPQGKCTSDS